MMLRQKDMEASMLRAHRQFITGLEQTLDQLSRDIGEVEGLQGECNDEWCKSREDFLDYLHKSIYAVSEPRWADKEDSDRINSLRERIRNLYNDFKGVNA
jgi:hypothetical protein